MTIALTTRGGALIATAAGLSLTGTARTVVDLTDEGVSTFSTTGTIGAASNSLVVADASGLSIGDSVIVQIGGESGTGLRGTVGVGGVWPDLSYANIGAMNADTGQGDGQYAYLVSTGNVYRSNEGAWAQQIDYYTAKVIPRSLVAEITGKSGNVLTLDTAATVTATSATVYFDNAPLVADVIAGASSRSDLVWPHGDFAMSEGMMLGATLSYMQVRGAGVDATRLFFPDGISDLAVIQYETSHHGRVRDLTVEATARNQGYMIAWLNGDETSAKFAYGIYFHTTNYADALDTKSIDCFQGGVLLSFCLQTSAYRHHAVLTEAMPQYVQWQILGADSDQCHFVDCSITSFKLTGGIEWFRSVNCTIQNYTGINASMSMNGSDNWVISSPSITVEADSYSTEAAFSRNNPLININTNIGGSVPIGGTISNVTITQGYINADNDVLQGIIVNADNPNIAITGGTIDMPDYAAPSLSLGALGVNSTGLNCDVSNLTVIGEIKAGSGYGNIHLVGAGSSAVNCTAGVIVQP